MTKHTPTPWDQDYGNGYGRVAIKASGVTIAVAHRHDKECNGDGIAQAEANARHIVHCVNTHDQLVEALSEAEAVLSCYSDVSSMANDVWEIVKSALAAARSQ